MSTKQKTFYFIGIGGVGMSALARLCLMEGHSVFGYDKVKSVITQDLSHQGIQIFYDEGLEDLPEEVLKHSTEIIYTAAIPDSHKQLQFFKNSGFLVRKRAVFLADWCAGKTTLAVAGTHGKTTTMAFLTHIFSQTGQSFTALMGGFFQNNHSNLFRTGEEFVLVEADEYDRSFLHLHPTIAAVTSLDPDHLDIYETAAEFKSAFKVFSEQVSQKLIVAHGIDLPGLSYGIDIEADYQIFNIKYDADGYLFDLKTPQNTYTNLRLNQLGVHNLANMLCAVALADQVQIPLPRILEALISFPGVYRRMNCFKWKKKLLIDDYAHHPSEIKTVLETLKGFYPDQRLGVVFQPHLFSRTKDFYHQFIAVLSEFDEVILLEIYPAREKPIEGISSNQLLKDLEHPSKRLITKREMPQAIQEGQSTVFALLGAGDIGVEIQKLKSQNDNI